MDELNEVKKLRAGLATEDDAALARHYRQRFDAERERAGRFAGFGRRLAALRRRLWVPLTAGVLAIGILVGVAVLRDATPGSSILQQAAAELAAGAEPVTVPGPQKWYYLKDLRFWIGQGDIVTEHERWERADNKYSADYGGSGRMRKEQPRSNTVARVFSSLVEVYQFYERLPDDPEAVLDAIRAKAAEDRQQLAWGVSCDGRCDEGAESDWNRAGKAFELIILLLAVSDPPDSVQAKLFRALAEIPGVEDVGTVTDIRGEKALAVSWFVPDDGSQGAFSQSDRFRLLIDPATHRYRGWELVYGSGKVWRAEVLLRAGFVETQGDIP